MHFMNACFAITLQLIEPGIIPKIVAFQLTGRQIRPNPGTRHDPSAILRQLNEEPDRLEDLSDAEPLFQDKVLQDLLRLQTSEEFALSLLRQLRGEVRPPLSLAGHLHRSEELHAILHISFNEISFNYHITFEQWDWISLLRWLYIKRHQLCTFAVCAGQAHVPFHRTGLPGVHGVRRGTLGVPYLPGLQKYDHQWVSQETLENHQRQSLLQIK